MLLLVPLTKTNRFFNLETELTMVVQMRSTSVILKVDCRKEVVVLDPCLRADQRDATQRNSLVQQNVPSVLQPNLGAKTRTCSDKPTSSDSAEFTMVTTGNLVSHLQTPTICVRFCTENWLVERSIPINWKSLGIIISTMVSNSKRLETCR